MENFDALLSLMPRVSTLFLVGIAGMFIAPFGIVIAKWTAIRAFLEVPGAAGAAMILIMAFGSSLTIFYWGKLLIKVLSARTPDGLRALHREPRLALRMDHRRRHGLRRAGRHGLHRRSSPTTSSGPYALAAFSAAPRVFLAIDPVTLLVMLSAVLFLPFVALLVVAAPRRTTTPTSTPAAAPPTSATSWAPRWAASRR